MAAFAGIDKAVPAGGDSLGLGDDEIRALKLFLQEVLGIPDATTITNEAMNIAADGGITINDTGADIDFRVEGDNNANMIVVDAGQDALSFGGANVDGAAHTFNNLQQRTYVTSVGAQMHIPAQTTDFDNSSGTIAIGAAMFLGIPTVTNANATLTITDLATLYIQGAPVDSTNVTATNTVMALWVDAGRARFDGIMSVGSALASQDGTLHVHTATAGSVTANTGADDLVIENSAAGGLSILTPNNAAGGIFFGDPQDDNIGAIEYNHSTNSMVFTVAAGNRLALDDAGANSRVHINKGSLGDADVDFECSDGATIGAGDIHRASSGTHSSLRAIKSHIRPFTIVDERRCYEDIKTLTNYTFKYKVRGEKGGLVEDPDGVDRIGLMLDEAPQLVKALDGGQGIVIDHRISQLEMALKETIRKVEAAHP